MFWLIARAWWELADLAMPPAHICPYATIDIGNVEKSRQRRSRLFAVLTYSMYAPRVKQRLAPA
jgi:hypothetical protein